VTSHVLGSCSPRRPDNFSSARTDGRNFARFDRFSHTIIEELPLPLGITEGCEG
jgi:hypothetical protein